MAMQSGGGPKYICKILNPNGRTGRGAFPTCENAGPSCARHRPYSLVGAGRALFHPTRCRACPVPATLNVRLLRSVPSRAGRCRVRWTRGPRYLATSRLVKIRIAANQPVPWRRARGVFMFAPQTSQAGGQLRGFRHTLPGGARHLGPSASDQPRGPPAIRAPGCDVVALELRGLDRRAACAAFPAKCHAPEPSIEINEKNLIPF